MLSTAPDHNWKVKEVLSFLTTTEIGIISIIIHLLSNKSYYSLD